MTAKPSYEELERRVQALEKLVSEQSHSKKALPESERLFKMLYEKAPLGYQSLDENGHFIVVNQTWLDTLGYTREEVIGKSFADFLHPDWRDHFRENFPRFKAIGEIMGVEFQMVKKNGDFILVAFNGKIGRDQDGNFLQTHCILDDITERRRVEKHLKESGEKFKFLMQQAPFVVEIYDLNGLQMSVNKAYEELWGFPAETTLNKFNVLESKEVEETGLLEYVKRAYAGDSITVPEYFFDPSGDMEAKGVGRRRWLNTRTGLCTSLHRIPHVVV
jgi:PAS domain S-box-containing protein